MFRALVLLILVFAFVMFFTKPAYLSDTARYMTEIENHRAHLVSPAQDSFWDFGHLAWRPLASAAYGIAGGAIQRMRGGDARQALAWVMIAMNMLATLAALLLLWSLIKRHSNGWAAGLAAAAFLCTNSVLDYSRSGAAYMPALACLALALWLIQAACARPLAGAGMIVRAALAGLSLGASVLFWFPFVLAVPAAVLYALYRKTPTRAKLAGILLIFCGLAVTLAYAAAMQKRQIYTIAEFTNWVASSSNNISQTDKVKRAISGIPRSFLALGDDTLLLKRFVFHDPYTPVGLGRVLFAAGTIKLVLFYLYVGAVVVVLWKQPEGHLILLLLLVGSIPLLLFAVILFEPGSTERYMPVYPFFFLAAACALATRGGAYRTMHWGMAIFLVGVLCVGNVYAKASWRQAAPYRAFLERKSLLEAQAGPESMVAVINFWDPLYEFPPLRLLDSRAQLRNVWVYDVIEVASTRVFHWQQEFAANVNARWSLGRQVWLSRRLLADKPLAEWKWVEGDTGRVPWSALRDFFRAFHTTASTGGADGFVLMAQDPYNAERIRALTVGPSH